jgi:hypothetical protein
MSNLSYTFTGGYDRQTLFVSGEVTSSDGNFDILGIIYSQMGLPVLLEETCRLILGIYKSLKDT